MPASTVAVKIEANASKRQNYVNFWYTLIVKKDGTLWGCGSNECGQLGNGTTTDQHTPIKIMDDVASIDAAFHSLIVKKDGTLWACNRRGRFW